MYLDKVLAAMTKEDKKDLIKDVSNCYSPVRKSLKKYKGNLISRNTTGEMKYW